MTHTPVWILAHSSIPVRGWRTWGSRILKDNPHSLGLQPSTKATQPLGPWVARCARRWPPGGAAMPETPGGSSRLSRGPKPRTSRTPQLQVDRTGACRAVGAAVPFPAAPLPWPGSVQTSAAAQAVAPAGFADAWGTAPLVDLLPLSQPQSPRVSLLASLRALNVAQLHGRRNSARSYWKLNCPRSDRIS